MTAPLPPRPRRGRLHANVARGALVTIPVGGVLSSACGRAVTFKVEYVSSAGGLLQPTPLGSITIHEPSGAHPLPLPRRVVEQRRRSDPTRSLHAPIHLTLLPQPRAACNAAFLLYPCYKARSDSRLPMRSPLRPPATPGARILDRRVRHM